MKEQRLHRIFFSSNERTPNGAYWLGVSKPDLERIKHDLREGLRVIISEPNEIEMEATLHFDREYDEWTAAGDTSTIIYLSE